MWIFIFAVFCQISVRSSGANEALTRYRVTFRFSLQRFALFQNGRFIRKSLSPEPYSMWIDCGIKLVRVKCISFQHADANIKAGHAPNQISSTQDQTLYHHLLCIGSVIIDRSLTRKVHKNFAEWRATHRHGGALNIDAAQIIRDYVVRHHRHRIGCTSETWK